MIVRFKKKGGPLHFVLKTNDTTVAVHWWCEYAYDKNQQPFCDKGQGKQTCSHALGMPHELDNDNHAWQVALANIGDGKEGYKVQITWHQDGAELPDKWAKVGNIKPGAEAEPLKDSAWLIAED